MESKNYYDILGVSVKASLDEITAAKNALAKKYHPDANMKDGIDTTEKMQEILEAYRILSNEKKRKKYDRELSGRKGTMQTFDLHEMQEDEPVNNSTEPTFLTYWKASGALYEIVEQSLSLTHKKEHAEELASLASAALKHIILLRNAQIPEKYWHPDTMNWLLFKWYQNRNVSIAYLLTLYDEHEKRELSRSASFKLKNQARRYQSSVKKLLKY